MMLRLWASSGRPRASRPTMIVRSGAGVAGVLADSRCVDALRGVATVTASGVAGAVPDRLWAMVDGAMTGTGGGVGTIGAPLRVGKAGA